MMPDPYDLSDSSDWLPTPLAALAPLDSSLRCQVCKDFFTTPMITSCSHTFCSLCIRRYLSQEGKCPACREPDQEVKLRRNCAVEEMVVHFTTSRENLLVFAKNAEARRDEIAEAERPKKRRKVAAAEPITNGLERRSTRSQSKRTAEDASQQSAPSTQEVIDDSDDGSIYENNDTKSPHFTNGASEPKDGLVGCPCCHRRMKESLINTHLDKCIAGESFTPADDDPSPAPSKSQVAQPGTIAYTLRKPSKDNERLPFINYSLLGDNALRKKLRDLGIPNHGSKELMRRRHTEWVNLWNANCDSTTPVTKRQLLQNLKVWEDTLGRQMDRTPNSGFMAKEFDRDRHVKAQKSNFDDLIQKARQRRAAAMPKTSETTGTHSRDGLEHEGSTSVAKATEEAPVVDGLGMVLTQNEQDQTGAALNSLPPSAESASLYLHDGVGLQNQPPSTDPAMNGTSSHDSVVEIPREQMDIAAGPGSQQ